MQDITGDVWAPTSAREKSVFSHCDLCEKPYLAQESEISNPTSAVSEEELNQQIPLLLIRDSCREELEVFPLTQNP